MSLFNDRPERRVIPRWRDSTVTSLLHESDPLPSRDPERIVSEESFQQRLDEWRHNRALPYAAELVGAGLVLGHQDQVTEAAEFILAVEQAPEAARRIAARSLALVGRGPLDELQLTSRETIRQARQRLRVFPHNPLEWVDLARQFTRTGQLIKARHAMSCAIELGGHDRFTLRSATRLLLHVGDTAAALRMLRRSPATRRDPWLLAAEVATATVAGVPPRFIKEARNLIKGATLHPWHLNELASAMATLELNEGSTKRARQLFALSLKSPTDNSVAQLQWAKSRLSTLELPQGALEMPRVFEAISWERYESGGWESSLAATERWLDDEPFSARPAIMGTFISAVLLEAYDRSVEIARRGLTANPENQTLRNNLVFALASAGHVEQAIKESRRVTVERFENPDAAIAWTATRGLLAFRGNRVEEGRKLYRDAIELAKRDERMRAFAAAFLAREEILARTTEARAALTLALEMSRRLISPPLADLLVRVTRLKESLGLVGP